MRTLLRGARMGKFPMDQRIESFLTDVLALAGEDPEAIREGVRVALADCEEIFRAQEMQKRLGQGPPIPLARSVPDPLRRACGHYTKQQDERGNEPHAAQTGLHLEVNV